MIVVWRRKKRELTPKHGTYLATEMADLWLLLATAKINRCRNCRQAAGQHQKRNVIRPVRLRGSVVAS